MDKRVTIPIRIQPSSNYQSAPAQERDIADTSRARDDGLDGGAAAGAQTEKRTEPSVPAIPQPEVTAPEVEGGDDAAQWRDRALRLQAEMANYRKRQQRLAQAEIEAERQRLLSAFLPVVDDLGRALHAPAGDAEAMRQGVQMTHRAALQTLQREGVEQIRADKQPFDPAWHDAVATVGRNGSNVAPNTVVRVLEPGYRLGDQLLRPAKVVVAI